MMTPADVKNYLGIGRDTSYKLFKLSSFPAVHINNRGFVFKDDLDNWLRENRGKTIYL